jgi:hypothetical protein
LYEDILLNFGAEKATDEQGATSRKPLFLAFIICLIPKIIGYFRR